MTIILLLLPSGAGNTPAVIDDSASVEMAVSSILLSKTFDNGVICASEQSVVVCDKVYDKVRAEFVRRGAYFLNEAEKASVLPCLSLNENTTTTGGELWLREGYLTDEITDCLCCPLFTSMPTDPYPSYCHLRSRCAPSSSSTAG